MQEVHGNVEASLRYTEPHFTIKIKPTETTPTPMIQLSFPTTTLPDPEVLNVQHWMFVFTLESTVSICSPDTCPLHPHKSEPLIDPSRSAGAGQEHQENEASLPSDKGLQQIPPMHSAACIGLVYTACLEGPMLYPIDGQCQRHECLLLRQGELSETIFSLFNARVPARLLEVP